MLWLYQRTMFGGLDNPENQKLKDCNTREILYLAPLVAACFWIGLYPKPFFRILEKPVARIVQQLGGEQEGVALGAGTGAAERAAADAAALAAPGEGHQDPGAVR
jgi:NADH:ubiquinone oxidoreductase subunit 4 (subunit M)